MEHILSALAGLGLLPDPDPFEGLSEREVAIRTAFRCDLDEARDEGTISAEEWATEVDRRAGLTPSQQLSKVQFALNQAEQE